ncbi:GDSL-type esterase/lipase family protein [Bifidobacterium sp. ESL0682]|uniref:SGNH/GDSL hydrolase family protein n=1 Tax=Bifidobacterium sp. ESL0682 TaxID=2983212 RepID=UPI0023F88148|nr:GDSL-type esterase/lipase family protein [Bifidobacterium sp. ESL0682]WEV41401.1 GDSL-type esterase/lipase family protein [Bifidobacterium sp. ESL0682]
MTLGIGTPVATLEALWAKHTIHLAEAPGGEPSGIKKFKAADVEKHSEQPSASDPSVPDAAKPLTVCAIGDSMIAGCGTQDQQEGLVPDIAEGFARAFRRDVAWEAHGKLGATMRRVRYRLLPEVLKTGKTFDILVLCAGSNDIMANRTLDEWRDDLGSVLEEAKPLSDHIVVLSPGQMQHEPSLGRALRRALEREMDEQAAVSKKVCAEYHATYVDMIHENVHADAPDFFSPDHFHPSAQGYQYMVDGVIAKLGSAFVQQFEAQ